MRRTRLFSLRVWLAAGLLAGALATGVSAGEPSRSGGPDGPPGEARAEEPALAPARDPSFAEFERQPVIAGAGEAGNVPADANPAGDASPWGALLRLVGGLCVVAAIVCGGAVLMRKLLPGRGRFFGGGAVEVLGRTHLDQRRYLATVRVGARVLVLGVGPDGMSTVCELTDPDEAAEALRQCRPASASGKEAFRSLLAARTGQVPADAGPERPDADGAAPGGGAAGWTRAMDGIHAQLRGLRGRG